MRAERLRERDLGTPLAILREGQGIGFLETHTVISNPPSVVGRQKENRYMANANPEKYSSE